MFLKKFVMYLKDDFRIIEKKAKNSSIMNRKNKSKSELSHNHMADKFGFSSEKSLMFLLWKKKFYIIFLTLAFMVVLGLVFAYNSGNTLTTTLTLNYEEASKGLNPNSTRYNMYELKSNAVMERAISNLGLTGDLSPEDLARNISIENANLKQITSNENSYFISTSYQITYKMNKEAKSFQIEDVMRMICKSYNDIFHENYADKKTALFYNSADLTDMEYVEIGDAISRQANRMKDYLSGRAKENGTFKSEETGETFQTLRRLVENMIDYDISKYNSYVLETGLAKDKEQFIKTLYYKNSVLDMQYQKSMADYSVRKDGVTKYDEAMIGTVMIPSVNRKDEYYMSRTNIGIDYLAKDADTHLTMAKDTLKEIEINNDIINKLSANQPTLDDYNKAADMLKNINNEFEKISESALATDREYISYKTKDYLTFTNERQSFVQRFSPKKVVLYGGMFFIALCVIIYLISKRSLKYKEGRI